MDVFPAPILAWHTQGDDLLINKNVIHTCPQGFISDYSVPNPGLVHFKNYLPWCGKMLTQHKAHVKLALLSDGLGRYGMCRLVDMAVSRIKAKAGIDWRPRTWVRRWRP